MNTTSLTFEENDAFDRENFSQNLQDRILKQSRLVDESFTVALNGTYGSGKTWFLKMWEQKLKKERHGAIYIDLWRSELHGHPLIDLSRSISKLPDGEKLKKTLQSLCKLVAETSPSLLGGLPGGLIVQKVIESAQKATVQSDLFQKYEEKENIVSQLEQGMQKMIGKEKTLFVLVDELDRTKPPYALKVLETIKHFFSIKGMVFVLAVNKKELEISIKHQYGDEIDCDGYLKRFFRMEEDLPIHDYSILARHMYEKINSKVQAKFDEQIKNAVLGHLSAMMDVFGFSLREAEHLEDNLAFFFDLEAKESWRNGSMVSLGIFVLVLRSRRLREFEDMFDFMTSSYGPHVYNTRVEKINRMNRLIGKLKEADKENKLSHMLNFLARGMNEESHNNLLPFDCVEDMATICEKVKNMMPLRYRKANGSEPLMPSPSSVYGVASPPSLFPGRAPQTD